MRFTCVLFIAAIIAVTSDSCIERGGKFIKEGEIHYSIDYSGTIGLMPREILPKNLVVYFKNNKIMFEMITPIGNSGILNLSNPEKDIYDTYFSFFTLKYCYPAKRDEMYPGFEAMEGMELRMTENKAIICGFDCKSAEATFPADRKKVYQIWYTNEIHVKNPNVCSPFHQIDGILMNFFFLIGHSELHFNAENVYRKDIPDQVFDRREKFPKVSKDSIIRFMNKMLTL